MDLTTTIAKVFAIYLIVSGVALVFRRKTLVLMLKDFSEHPAIVWLAAVVLIFLGGFMVVSHNVWQGTLPTWVTVLAWAVLAKGVAYMVIPDQMLGLVKKFKTNGWLMPVGILVIVLGFWLFVSAS